MKNDTDLVLKRSSSYKSAEECFKLLDMAIPKINLQNEYADFEVLKCIDD